MSDRRVGQMRNRSASEAARSRTRRPDRSCGVTRASRAATAGGLGVERGHASAQRLGGANQAWRGRPRLRRRRRTRRRPRRPPEEAAGPVHQPGPVRFRRGEQRAGPRSAARITPPRAIRRRRAAGLEHAGPRTSSASPRNSARTGAMASMNRRLARERPRGRTLPAAAASVRRRASRGGDIGAEPVASGLSGSRRRRGPASRRPCDHERARLRASAAPSASPR